MKIYENGQDITDKSVQYSHTVSVYPKQRNKFSDFSGITFYNVNTIILTEKTFTICDKDYGSYTYDKKDRIYKVR